MSLTDKLIAAAFTGAVLGAVGCASTASQAEPTTPGTATAEKHSCKGEASCSGKSSCKGEHSCSGQAQGADGSGEKASCKAHEQGADAAGDKASCKSGGSCHS